YGDEICYVNGMQYALEVSAEAARYRLASVGLGSGPKCLEPDRFASEPYEMKSSDTSSHAQILEVLGRIPPSRVLDLGCSSGLLSEQMRKLGHTVVGLDVEAHEGVHSRVDEFITADLEKGIPDEAGKEYD